MVTPKTQTHTEDGTKDSASLRICMDVNISQGCSTYHIETLKDL